MSKNPSVSVVLPVHNESAVIRQTLQGVRKALQGLSQGVGPQGQQDLSKNPEAVANVVNRELAGKALSAYARKQGIESSGWYKSSRQEVERNSLASLLIDNVIRQEVTVTDKEVEAAYKERYTEMFPGGKKFPLAAVKEQVRLLLQSEKRRRAFDAYVGDLNRKAKVSVNDAVLSKV